MAGIFDGAVQNLIDAFSRLPSIGPKSAQRIVFYLLEQDEAEVKELADALLAVKEKVHFCEICGNVTEQKVCTICSDPRRSEETICVVEEAKDIVAIERTREYRGKYHVLGGSINPIRGIGPEDLRIRELLQRLQNGAVQEVILATDPNIEGEATAAYIIRLLSPIGIKISRLASGLPVGGDLEYADEITLSRAFEGRTKVAGFDAAPAQPATPEAATDPATPPNPPAAPAAETGPTANTNPPATPDGETSRAAHPNPPAAPKN
ncbi:DNA replication and repair protein RecR [Actinobaculum suis]|uniref:Recombination protein RecR n=1 Tax=Actinobaculum suis TaxID=1657 RepID=A0A1G7B5J9_9ACTO|nr:DNA replication and repair protein RecR [Actinobaculum suis]